MACSSVNWRCGRCGSTSRVIPKRALNLSRPASFRLRNPRNLRLKFRMQKRHVPLTLGAAVLLALFTYYFNSIVAVRAARPPSAIVSDLSSTRYFDHVKYLSSDEMKGRGNGTPELDKAADYIASQFRLWGLRPM